MHSRSSSITTLPSPIDCEDLSERAEEIERDPKTPSGTVDWINFTGATPDFPGQRTLMAWKEGRAQRLVELEDDKEGKIILISSSPPNSPAIKVEDVDLPNLGEINDGLMANGERRHVGAATEKRELIVISSSPPNSYTPVIEIEDDDWSDWSEIDDREMIAPAGEREGAGSTKEGDQPQVAIPKRKRDIDTDPVEEEAAKTNVNVPHKKQRVSRLLKVRVPTDACSIEVVVKFHEGDADTRLR